jgi:hypothetical protein
MNTKHKSPLSDRIADALRSGTSSDLISRLIAETEAARSAAEVKLQSASDRAIDPLAAAAAASSGRQEAEDLRFEIERFEAALGALQTAHEDAKTLERDTRRRLEYERVKAERDELISELRDLYPQIEKQLTDLMRRIVANDTALAEVNSRLPSGLGQLARVDEVARGRAQRMLDPDRRLTHDLTRMLRLPGFEIDALAPYGWPIERA